MRNTDKNHKYKMHDFICIHIQQNEEHAWREMTDNQIHSDKFCIYRFQKKWQLDLFWHWQVKFGAILCDTFS